MKNIETPGFILPDVEDITRRDFLVGGAAAILLGGCGGSGDVSETSSETRAVEHALGTTEVPVRPQRAVALFGPTLSALSLLDVGLAGSTGYDTSGDHNWNYFVSDGTLEDLEFVGMDGEPNIERIAALYPDLIMGSSRGFEEENYVQLSEIAPTVLFEWEGTRSWKKHFDQVAAAVGKAEEARNIVDRYEGRAEDAGRRIRDAGETEISLIRWDGESIRINLDNTFGGSILKDIGLSRPESQVATGDEEFPEYVNYSVEEISAADADVILVLTYNEEARSAFTDFQNNPLWRNLNAVENDRVYEVSAWPWEGSNYYSANLVLDDIEKYLTR